MLESLRNSNKTVGLKQSIKAVENGAAKIIFIARDADERIISSISDLALRNSIEVVYVENMKQLGKACGIEVGSAVACMLK